jgi:hypothetical protein
VHALDAEVFRVSPGRSGIRPDSTIVNEGLARWTYEGRTGYGISEYLHQLEAELLRVEPGNKGIKPSTTIVNEGLARWTYEGRTGTGISEYLHQLDENAEPVVRID